MSAQGQLVQILLPVADDEGRSFGAAFEAVKQELTDRFGGVTAFTQSPAEGLWAEGGKDVERDRIVIFEVITERLDEGWWRGYRRELERRFRQDVVVIRALPMKLI